MKAALYALALCSLALASCNKDEVIVDEPEVSDGRRPVLATSSAAQTVVYEYLPAPGQFINDPVTAGFTGSETSPEAAAEYALGRLERGLLVSLGSFGGYIVVGFDHSIVNTGGYDFAIQSNSIEGSNEPGVVWVMQDTNGNCLPDDTWYELRGSESGLEGTIEDYAVTYYRPSEAGQSVRWTDSLGGEGEVAYLKSYHRQDYYYPMWTSGESLTLRGTRLQARNYFEGGVWYNPAYSWGYADNLGTDTTDDGLTMFKISNAMDASGNAVALKYIDFVKVQSAVLAQSGWIGENSCEVLGFTDLSLLP